MLRRTILLSACAAPAWAALPDPIGRELNPTGVLRLGVGVGPVASAFWCVRDPATGRARGVPVTLGTALAAQIEVPLVVQDYDSSGAVTEAGVRGEWDVTFMPADAERATKVDFGAAYFQFVSTYLVPEGSAIRHVDDVNRPGMRVFGITGTTTLRSAARVTDKATVTGLASVDAVLERFRAGEVDAIALGRESLEGLLPKLPGARITDGHYQATSTAVAVPKGRPLALAYASTFVEEAKRNGLVRRALDEQGIGGAVAPAGLRA